ncbi:GbsR/MarR family transcriptional regulator [Polaribacter batillariae]|uniref:GbsR/MarR family transcriptional regulator n=1 Tax=Polaribacter batillariae TaxID=2808900 RepID=UPI00349E5F99
MELNEAKNKYIQTWGSLATSWGINKTMAQVHALLLVSTKPLSAEDIMKELQISRGNVNMNVRALMDWGIVQKEFVVGERKEFLWQIKTFGNCLNKLQKSVKNAKLNLF